MAKQPGKNDTPDQDGIKVYDVRTQIFVFYNYEEARLMVARWSPMAHIEQDGEMEQWYVTVMQNMS